MSKGGKIAVTILLIVGFIFISVLLIAAGFSKTFMALLALGLFYGIRAMWKNPKESSSTEIKLDKSQNTEKESNLAK